ncbi:MAG: dihydroneopterin triphosphate diphosphatase [Rhizobacter sp.]|jgi:dATP pyrophosphohydrolase|nr:dihydroneopterin triphosphate diphosphatase [Burkholderiaceae bacterium]MCO5125144.1 dihydroneopterin triphosphate diphosphatase [Rhizobacter sp.]
MATDAAAAQRPFKIPESVLVVIHSAEGEVLLLERADMPGHWQGVTGAKDSADEPLFETAIREVAEETGIVVGSAAVPRSCLVDWQMRNVFDIYPHYLHRYAPGVTRNVEHVFGLRVPRDVTITLAPREHTRWRWLPALAAADACFSSSNAEAILQLPRRLQAGTKEPDRA